MTWYAIRTLPGAQQPKREYWHELGATKYRLMSGVCSDHSAIEIELERAGITSYMPAEFEVVRNRHKRHLYELRRFALLKGYMFAELAGADFDRVTRVVGVRDVVGNNDKPFAISPLDLFHLRMFEAKSRGEAECRVRQLTEAESRLDREKRKLIIRGAKKKLHRGRDVKLVWGDKVGRDATVQAWTDQEQVRIILQGLDDAAREVVTVPYEFLKATG